MPKIRTFVAIKIPETLETAFDKMLLQLRQLEGDVKWVKADAIHITLKFLGEITPAEVENVFYGVEKKVAGVSKFSLFSGEKGAFPSFKQPRVFWVGLQDINKDRLLELQKNIENELAERGFPPENRRFQPHLTVGRVRGPRGVQSTVKAFAEYPFPEIEIPVESVLVMKSELTRQGAIYSVQKSFSLQQ